MARNTKGTEGYCQICGKYGPLSFEHVPPRKAFNQHKLIAYSIEDWRQEKKRNGIQLQRGLGEYTLCANCNNNTGAWYANEYVKWALIGNDILQDINSNRFQKTKSIGVIFEDVYPLRFLKQVITCFFSVIGKGTTATFAQNYPDLVKLVLDKEEINFPSNILISMSLYKGPIIRLPPLAGRISLEMDEQGILKLHPWTFSEIAYPPFALNMTLSDQELPSDTTNITHFHKYGYNDRVNLPLQLHIGEGKTPYPGQY